MRRVLIGLMVSLWVCGGAAAAVDVTFFVSTDQHLDSSNKVPFLSNGNRSVIQALNGLAGTAYPSALGGTIGTPAAVIAPGDLTFDGLAWQWSYASDGVNESEGWDYRYPLNGVAGDVNRVKYPTLATVGNHDLDTGHTASLDGVIARHGNTYYSRDIGGVHVVSLGEYPDAATRTWLASDLASIGSAAPVVVFQHYVFPGVADTSLLDDWSGNDRTALAGVLAGHNILAILHGHDHAPQHYQWSGYNIYDPGAADSDTTSGHLGILHITDTQLTFAAYTASADGSGNWTNSGTWAYTNTQAISVPEPGAALPVVLGAIGLLHRRRNR